MQSADFAEIDLRSTALYSERFPLPVNDEYFIAPAKVVTNVCPFECVFGRTSYNLNRFNYRSIRLFLERKNPENLLPFCEAPNNRKSLRRDLFPKRDWLPQISRLLFDNSGSIRD